MKRLDIQRIARVEGEGALRIYLSPEAGVRLMLRDPPRLFESFLIGKHREQVPDMVARICGICPVSHQVTSAQALEAAAGQEVSEPIRALRRLMMCGEWIESHVLHMVLLHAPDFLGFADVLQMSSEHPGPVKGGLELKRIGNRIKSVLGARAVHPVNLRIGGFHRLPEASDLARLVPELEHAGRLALENLRWVSGFALPAAETETLFVGLRSEDKYPMTAGRLAASTGLEAPVDAFETLIEQKQVPYSNALQGRLGSDGRITVGPMARFNLNFGKLPEPIQEICRSIGLFPPCRNPFSSILVRAVETLYASQEALRLVRQYERPASGSDAADPVEATGCSAAEAPRGLLYHRYATDRSGKILSARIVTPTALNQGSIEADIKAMILKDSKQLRSLCERAIRNYDPCISCSIHLISLDERDRSPKC